VPGLFSCLFEVLLIELNSVLIAEANSGFSVANFIQESLALSWVTEEFLGVVFRFVA
jgi:hypothetical protein